jgi:hypothetical protein
VWLCTAAGLPLMYVAAAVSLAQLYRAGAGAGASQAYRAALGRIGSLLLLHVFAAVGFVLLLLALMVATVIVMIPAIGIAAVVHVQAIVALVFALVGLALLLAFLVLFGFAIMAYGFALLDVALGERAAWPAFRMALARTFGRGTRKRTLAFALVITALSFGEVLVSISGTSLIGSLVHVRAVNEAFATLVEFAADLVFIAFLIVAYFDVRVRREGLDLEVAAPG